MSFCVSFGKKLPENVKFCPFCGAEVPAAVQAAPAAGPSAPAPAPAVPVPPVAPAPDGPGGKKGGSLSMPLLVAGAMLIAVLATLAVVFFMRQPQNGDDPQPAEPGTGAPADTTVDAEPTPTPETPDATPEAEPEPDAGTQTVSRADIPYIGTDAEAPWHGVWKDAESGTLMLWETQEIGGDYGEQQPDGSYLITVQYLDGSQGVGYRLSADGNVLESLDGNGNVYMTYVTPALADAPAPLPEETWGYYGCTEALDYARPVHVDAFRLGDALYTSCTDNGDGTYTLMATDDFGMEEPIDVHFYTDGTTWYLEWVYDEYLPPYGKMTN